MKSVIQLQLVYISDTQRRNPPLYFLKTLCFMSAPLLTTPIVWPLSSPTESSCTR